ncbi:uncharacterized protein [Diadema setosum]|uniref:uncharacterized protein isoform X2 n=1 Tax=Diadema setosum TaxID=31175 RepID=UPI003B3B60F4
MVSCSSLRVNSEDRKAWYVLQNGLKSQVHAMASSQQSDHLASPLTNGDASHGSTNGNSPVQHQRGGGKAYGGGPPNKKSVENTVISIFRGNKLMRVVMGEDVPFMCARCGLAFTHTEPLREHARVHHFYVEPSVMLRDGQCPQMMMKRIFKPSKTKQPAPVQRETNGDMQNEPLVGETDKQVNRDSESGTSAGVENGSRSIHSKSMPSTSTHDDDDDSVGCVSNGDDSSSDNSSVGEKAESRNFKSFKNKTSITVRVPKRSLDDERPSEQNHSCEQNHSGHAKKRKKSCRGGYPCRFCGKSFKRASQRRTHTQEVHKVFNTKEEVVEFQKKMQELSTGSEAGFQSSQTLRPLKCPHCPIYFTFESSLERHIQSHCGTHGIKCDICKEGIRLWNEGKNLEISGLLKKYKAELAEQIIREGQELPGELESDQLPKAVDDSSVEEGKADGEASNTSNDTETRNQEILRLSLEKAGRLSGNACIIDCIECGERFYLRHHLCNHYKTHKIFHCKSCPESFTTMIALGDHYAKVHKEGFVQCFFCPMRFFSPGKSTYHMLGHLGIFQCICCGFTCMSKQSLEKHIEAHSFEEDHAEPPEAPVGIQYSSLNPFLVTGRGRKSTAHLDSSQVKGRSLPRVTCKHCQRSFSRVGNLKKHVLFSHPSEASPKDVDNSFICDQCGELFLSLHSLIIHQEIHKDRKILCTKGGCYAKFRSDRGLQIHLQQHKEVAFKGTTSVRCSTCGKKFRTERNLRRHMLLHEGKNPDKCRFCDKIILNTTALWYHEQQVHTDEKNHECPHCKKRYACPSTLKVHLLTHSEDKPFVCEHCGVSFSDVWRLRAHLRIHTKPFKCEQCGEGFAQRGGRRNHLRRAHGVYEPVTRKYQGCSWSRVNTDQQKSKDTDQQELMNIDQHESRVSFGQGGEDQQEEMEHTESLQPPVDILEARETGENNATLGEYHDEATSLMLQLVEECKVQQL